MSCCGGDETLSLQEDKVSPECCTALPTGHPSSAGGTD